MRNAEDIRTMYQSLLSSTTSPGDGERAVLDTLQWVLYADEAPDLVGRHLLPAS
jgi:hypothetical protein